jgi:hypothetical protein
MNIMHVNWNDAAEIVTFLPFSFFLLRLRFLYVLLVHGWGITKRKKKDCSALVKRMMVVLLYINILFFPF